MNCHPSLGKDISRQNGPASEQSVQMASHNKTGGLCEPPAKSSSPIMCETQLAFSGGGASSSAQ
ncbi:hypothetical protein DXT98_04320 [Agrobacterium sp. ICMP 7243]|nr:hypothetical protein DXT98_04320 [Agrobacterium sp. ICMP 7243]